MSLKDSIITTWGPRVTSLTWKKTQFKSINTFDYIITLIKRRKKNIINFMRIYFFLLWRNLNPLHPRMLCAEIGWNWLWQWFWRRGFFNFDDVFSLFCKYLPLEKSGPFIWTNLNPHDPRMLCAKFGWNWPSGSGEEDF